MSNFKSIFKIIGCTTALTVFLASQVMAKPVQVINKAGGTVVVVDLKDPNTVLSIGLPNNATKANTMQETYGDESFSSMVKKAKAAVVMNGTFFAKNSQKTVMGNMVSNGNFVKYSQWEKFGTTLGIKPGNIPEMKTYAFDGRPNWESHWFSMTCGPRLLNDGEVFINATEEGFKDPHVLGVANRNAMGFDQSGNTLYLAVFPGGYSLTSLAKAMKSIGCYQAMNLDGGGSQGLAINGSIRYAPGRYLTNVIVVYDSKVKAPSNVLTAFNSFSGVSGEAGTSSTTTTAYNPAPTPMPTPFTIPNNQENEIMPSIPPEVWNQLSEEEKQAIMELMKPTPSPTKVTVKPTPKPAPKPTPKPTTPQKLKPGEFVNYANLPFMYFAGEPVAGVNNNVLTLAKNSNGIIFAPMEDDDFTLEFEAKLEQEKYGIYFDVLPVDNDTRLKGMKCEYGAEGLVLYKNDESINTYSVIKGDNKWHKFKVALKGDFCQIYFDNERALIGLRPHFEDKGDPNAQPNYGDSLEFDRMYKGTWGLGFEGKGSFRNFKIIN